METGKMSKRQQPNKHKQVNPRTPMHMHNTARKSTPEAAPIRPRNTAYRKYGRNSQKHLDDPPPQKKKAAYKTNKAFQRS